MSYLYYNVWQPLKQWILYKSPIAPFLGYDRRIPNEGWPRLQYRDEMTGYTFSQIRKLSIKHKELYGTVKETLEADGPT